jgi:hypothetical protein
VECVALLAELPARARLRAGPVSRRRIRPTLEPAAGVYATLENLFLGSVHPRGVGEFVLPGLLKVSLRKVPARKAGTLIRNPSTGEMVEAAAKPASVRVKIRALSKLKIAASP